MTVASASSPRGTPPISSRPVLVPVWASLESDQKLYLQPPVLRSALEIIKLDAYARCSCECPTSSDLPILLAPCMIYSIQEAFPCMIELQLCPKKCSGSRFRHIGPDGATLGVFNYNNRMLFSHDLLDDYTLAYTSSETPFTSWVGVVQQWYRRFSPVAGFVSEEIFRAAWFSYSVLQDFGNDMLCPVCGPEPSTVIFNGVTVAFGKKHLTSSLRPPTMIDQHSPRRECNYIKGQAALKDATARKLVRAVITGRLLIVTDAELSQGQPAGNDPDSDNNSGSDFEGTGRQSTNKAKMLQDVIERVGLIPQMLEQLNRVDTSLAVLFDRYFGLGQIQLKIACPKEIRHLF